MSNRWEAKIITDSCLTTKHLIQISSREIPGVIFPKVLNSEECRSITKKILSHNQRSPGLGGTEKIGESINAYPSNKFEYFQKAKHSNHSLKKVFFHNDPRQIMLSKISSFYRKEIHFAKEGSLEYSNGIIRLHKPGNTIDIHRDNASFDAPSFLVSGLLEQMSSILYLQEPESGGNLIVYDKLWEKDDEKFRNPEFGYSHNVINKVRHTSIQCNEGDLVIINPRNYHSVETVRGKLQRLTIGFFFGADLNSNLLAWS